MWKKTFVRGRIPENVEEFLSRWKENFFKWMVSSDKWMKTLRLWINFGRSFFLKKWRKGKKKPGKTGEKMEISKKGRKKQTPV